MLEKVRASFLQLRPGAFFGGVLLGFLACGLAGRALSGRDVLGDRPRLHDYLGPASAFYPTASQVVEMVAARSGAEQIAVIVGGNSVFHGAGQPVEQLWTKRLQELLGPEFAVSNLALKGATPMGAGSMAAEALTRRGRPVIFVTNTFPGDYAGPFGGAPFDYISWDAWEKGLLFADAGRRDFFQHHPQAASAGDAELRLRMRLDAAGYFNDLWTAAAYHAGGTIWEKNTNQRFFRPRKSIPDREPARRGGEAIPPERIADAQLAMRRMIARPFRDEEARAALPDVLKKRSLIVLSGRSPALVGELGAAERTAYAGTYATAHAQWTAAGYTAFDTSSGLLEAVDFWDGVHLTVAGGEKVAQALAPLVRGIAAREFGRAPQP